jgi:starvation-inducible DNA-binding protein
MTHNFHWNVTGPMFNTLHLMFMGQYTEQWNALDLIAERIRALGHPAPAPTRSSSSWPRSRKSKGVPKALDMVRHLVAAQEATARTARKLFPLVDKANDQPTADLLTQRMEVHEKTAWMLRSLLEEYCSPTRCNGWGGRHGRTVPVHRGHAVDRRASLETAGIRPVRAGATVPGVRPCRARGLDDLRTLLPGRGQRELLMPPAC